MNTNDLITRVPDMEALLPLVRGGMYQSIEENVLGKITGVTTAALIPSGQARVWEALTDFEHYQDFLPAIRRIKVRRHKEEIVIVSEVGLKLMSFGGYATFKQRIRREDPYLYLMDYDTRELTGFWKVMPLPHGRKTILLHYSIIMDIAELMSFVRWFVRMFPPAEIAIAVSPDIIMMQCMKRRMLEK